MKTKQNTILKHMKTCKTKHTILLNFNFKSVLQTQTSDLRHELYETWYSLDQVYIEINFELKHN